MTIETKKYDHSAILIILSLLLFSSCDFRPGKTFEPFSGNEPILSKNITGSKHQKLHITDLSSSVRTYYSGTSDTMKSESYLSFYRGELVEVYTLPDTIDPNAEPKPQNTIYKIIDHDGLKITGDLSNGLSTKNIEQTSEDRAVMIYMDSLDLFSEKFNQIERDTFDYRAYLKINTELRDYLDSKIEQVRYGNLRLTYMELAARQGFMSKKYIGDKVFWPTKDERLNNYMSKVYINTVRKLPPLSINDEIQDYLLSDGYDENSFFQKRNDNY